MIRAGGAPPIGRWRGDRWRNPRQAASARQRVTAQPTGVSAVGTAEASRSTSGRRLRIRTITGGGSSSRHYSCGERSTALAVRPVTLRPVPSPSGWALWQVGCGEKPGERPTVTVQHSFGLSPDLPWWRRPESPLRYNRNRDDASYLCRAAPYGARRRDHRAGLAWQRTGRRGRRSPCGRGVCDCRRGCWNAAGPLGPSPPGNRLLIDAVLRRTGAASPG